MSTIEKQLDDVREIGITKFNPEECKEKARTLRVLPEGIAYHFLVNPDPVNLKDKKIGLQRRLEEENVYLDEKFAIMS